MTEPLDLDALERRREEAIEHWRDGDTDLVYDFACYDVLPLLARLRAAEARATALEADLLTMRNAWHREATLAVEQQRQLADVPAGDQPVMVWMRDAMNPDRIRGSGNTTADVERLAWMHTEEFRAHEATKERIAALEIRVVELTLVGETLHHLARHADTCGLQHGSHCTCAIAAWERLTERRA